MKNSKFFIRITAGLLVLLMAVTFVVPLFASANAQDNLTEAQKKLDAISKELKGIKDSAKKQEAEKKQAQTQANLVKQQLDALKIEIDEAKILLAEKQEELDNKRRDIYETDQLFKERLKAMYIMRTGGSLATILGVESFSEMLTASNTLQNISKADTALLQKLDEEKKALEIAEAAQKEALANLELKEEAQKAKQNELAGYLQKIDSNLSALEAQEQAKQTEYADAKKIRDEAAEQVRKEFEASGGLVDFVGGEWMWPVPSSRRITSGYGNRNIFGYNEFHTGIDIAAGYGQPIVAANSGYVTTALYHSTGYGNRVIIDHGGDQKTLYAHCSSLAVKAGDYVVQGQIIAYIGSTGLSTGNHLHFEIRMNGATVNPSSYVR